ncbi:MAG: biotin/lipoyl-binding protein, partial [Ignavibacteriales bacterium]
MSKRFAFLILISFAAGLLSGCGNDTELHNDEHTEYTDAVKLTEESIKQIGLRTEITSLKPLSGFMSIPAKVLADQDKEAYVGSLIQGRVSKVFVKAGDYVKKGDELMQVEGLEVGVIKAAYLTAKASLEYLKQNYERQKSLIEQNAGSQKSFNEARAEYEKALAEYTAEDKKIHSIGLDDDDIINETRDEHTSGTLPVKA